VRGERATQSSAITRAPSQVLLTATNVRDECRGGILAKVSVASETFEGSCVASDLFLYFFSGEQILLLAKNS